MKYFTYTIAIFLILLLSYFVKAENVANTDPKQLIEKMIEVSGSYDDLKSLRDVEYKYTVKDKDTGKSDISVERYIFDGELSWGKFLQRDGNTFPELKGEIIQGYDGKESWMTVNGKIVSDDAALKYADFTRKTNFYWFAMMQKLLDPGIIYSYKGKEKVNGIEYNLVQLSYEPGIGDVSDTYTLYINPVTNLVDRFYFTVMDFGITEPILMEVEYKQFDGVKLPVTRKFSATVPDVGTMNIVEVMTDLKFNNGFNKSKFDRPAN